MTDHDRLGIAIVGVARMSNRWTVVRPDSGEWELWIQTVRIDRRRWLLVHVRSLGKDSR